MSDGCRSWWRNCAIHTDAEMGCIDKLEDEITPLDPGISRIRGLVGSLEICHHKADRWIENIIESIATGDTSKGLGTRSGGQFHPRETLWQDVCRVLTEWGSGIESPGEVTETDGLSSRNLSSTLGKVTPLKLWQVERVIQKIRSLIHFPRASEDPQTRFEWLLLDDVGDYEAGYQSQCPAAYKDLEEFWLTTVRTMIHDRLFGEETELSLALAIDMLWPCHWDFPGNLRIVLGAIGGNLRPDRPFAACGRNIHLLNQRQRFQELCRTLSAYPGMTEPKMVDEPIFKTLGEPSPEKNWLVASLIKTIQLQMDPPREMREAVSLATPDWVSGCC